MKPVSLCFKCFGPYMEEQFIDFYVFKEDGEGGIFLICGETGAGKTTILDAICCALYGESSGGARGGLEEMRCKLARPGDETLVEFIFELDGQRYCFVRSLKMARKNLNDGHNCMIWRDGAFYPLLANPTATNVSKQAEMLIGLTCDQFRQVVILPQGQFEKLLVSQSDEKEKILLTLFQAERWEKIVKEVKRRAKKQWDDCEKESEVLKAELSKYGCTSLETMDEALKEKRSEKKELAAEAETLEKQAGDFQKTYEDAIAEDKDFQELERRRKVLTDLTQQIGQMTEERRLLTLADRAEQVIAPYDAYHEQAGQLRAAEQKVKEAADAAENAQKVLEAVKKAQQELEDRRSEQESDIRQLHDWQGKKELYHSLSETAKNAAKAVAAAKKAQADLEAAEQHRTECKNRLSAAKSTQEEAEKAYRQAIETSTLARLKQALSSYQELQQALKQLQEAQKRFSDAEKDSLKADADFAQADRCWNDAMDRQRKAQNQYQEAQNAYLLNIGGILAKELQPGNPCPVCGSTSHPVPAALEGAAVSADDVEKLNQDCQRLGEEVSQKKKTRDEAEKVKNDRKQDWEMRKQAVFAAQAKYDTLAKQKIDGIETLDALQGQIEKAEQELEKCRKAEEDAKAQVAKAEQELEEAEKEVDTARSHQSSCVLEASKANTALQEKSRQKIPSVETEDALLAGIEALQKKTDDYKNRAEALQEKLVAAEKNYSSTETALAEAKNDQRKAETALAEKEKEWQEAMKASGLESEEQFLKVRIHHEELAQRKETLTKFETSLSAAEKSLQEKQKELAGREAPKLKALEAQRDESRTKADEASKILVLAERELKQMEDDYQALTKCFEQHDAAQRKAEEIKIFADRLISSSGISLQRYVLGVMLTSVTIEANRLLKSVHGGRYHLYRSDESTGSKHKKGLELEVLDEQNGERRSVTSLSGGEKFLVALTLAIGLSTVVQAQGSGIRLETMFIDEGFGSLDPKSIEDAFDVLQGIQRSKGLVGIISHVETLKETVQSRIEVVRGTRGNHLEIHL